MKKLLSVIAVVALICVLGVLFVACTPKANKYQDRLEKAGYEVTKVDSDELKEAEKEFGDLEWALVGSKDSEQVTVMCFKDKDFAKKAMEAFELMFGQSSNYVVYQDGKVLIYGTEAGVKAAK